MLRKILIVGLTIALAACATNAPVVETKRKPTAAANLPPANYFLNEWTDNRGCLYLKSEANGKVNWVPKVSINGSHICGTVAPTFDTGGIITDTQPAATVVNPAPTAPTVNVAAAPVASVAADAPSVVRPNVLASAVTPASTNEVIVAPISSPRVQVGSYAIDANAERAVGRLTILGYQIRISKQAGDVVGVQVLPRIGQTPESLLLEMRRLGYRDAILVK